MVRRATPMHDAIVESLRSVGPNFCVEAIVVIGQSTPEVASHGVLVSCKERQPLFAVAIRTEIGSLRYLFTMWFHCERSGVFYIRLFFYHLDESFIVC